MPSPLSATINTRLVIWVHPFRVAMILRNASPRGTPILLGSPDRRPTSTTTLIFKSHSFAVTTRRTLDRSRTHDPTQRGRDHIREVRSHYPKPATLRRQDDTPNPIGFSGPPKSAPVGSQQVVHMVQGPFFSTHPDFHIPTHLRPLSGESGDAIVSSPSQSSVTWQKTQNR